MMLEIRKDLIPIRDTKGEEKGNLCYSIEPMVFDENGEKVEMINNIEEMLGRLITIEVIIHYAKGIPEKWSSNVFTEYKWIDEKGKLFKTKYSEDTKNKNPKWEYRHLHNIYVSQEFIDHIKESPLLMRVYGKLSPEDIENLYEEFAQDPAKNALLANKMDDSDEEEKIDTSDPNLSLSKKMVSESKEIKEMKKRLEDYKKEQNKLEKKKVDIQMGKGGNG
mmetsp:Transcript_23949/g.23872  ORF Transcript_23949/g.23872 Transcript_23949/m.23872 type:complete len:221 (+) Transcript_23949:1979-2641(+)